MKTKLYYLIMLIVFVACNENKEQTTSATSLVYYTCSMDPQVIAYKPGNCPICKMPLTKVTKNNSLAADEIALSAQQIKLGNIKTAKVTFEDVSTESSITAVVKTNEALDGAVSVKVMGRIEKLYFKNKNDYVNKGEKLFELYSDELNLAKQEYMLAQEKKEQFKNELIDYEQLVIAAKNKLLLYGLSEKQIKEIANNNSSNTTTFYSPVSGFIADVFVNEGQYVMLGQEVMKLTDLSYVWVEAQAFNNQMAEVKIGQKVNVYFPDLPEKNQQAEIDFIYPVSKFNTRLNLFRVTVANKNNVLKPGMIAYLDVNKINAKVLALPVDAVLRNENDAFVWIETKKNKFKIMMVEVGAESNGMLEIKSGIKEGDNVVVSGAYLLNSEFILKKGTNTMESHNMSQM